MQQSWVIVGIIAALVMLMLLRNKMKSVSPIGQAVTKLKRLSEAYNGNADSPEDLTAWEQALSVMESHPSMFNKLNGDIHFVQAFTGYLEKYYPEDARLETLRQFAYYRKDSIWGIPIKRE